MSCSGGKLTAANWVSDPVDVVSGARAEINLDFSVAWPLPFEWQRWSDSTKVHLRGELGRGHAHEFERWLEFTTDGVRYFAPIGAIVDFPALLADGDRASAVGLTLRRVSHRQFTIDEPGKPTLEFRFADGASRGLLKALRRAESSIQLEHDAAGRVLSASPLGPGVGTPPPVVRFVRDESGALKRLDLQRAGEKDRTIAAFEFDEHGDLIRQTDPYNNAFSFKLDASGRCIKRTDPRGFSFAFEYDDRGRCIHARGDEGLHEVRLRYLPEQGVTQVTRGDGGLWQYFYTPDGVLTQVVDPYGGVKMFALAPDGRVEKEIDPNGNASRIVYSAAGAPTGRIDSLGRFTREGDDPAEPFHRVAANAAEYELGTLADSIVPNAGENGPREGAEYGPAFSPEPAEARPGEVLDPFGLLVQQRDGDAPPRRWVYTPNAWVEKYTDFDGSQYGYAYTLWNMLARETSPTGAATQYRYTAERKTSAVIDPGGSASEYEYDLKDRLVRIKRHGVIKEEYKYDSADNLVKKLDGHGRTLLDLEIGPGNLTTKRRLASGEEQTFAYDGAGRMTLAAGLAGATTFAYDGAGQRTADLRDGKGVTHQYGSGGVLRTTVLGLAIEYSRSTEAPGREMLHIRDPGGATHTIRFSEGLSQREHAGGLREVVQFDPAGRITRKSVEGVSASGGGLGGAARGAIWSRRFTYSHEGDLKLAEDSVRGDTSYTHDADHRLTGMTGPDGAPESFTYDPAGNLLSQPGLTGTAFAQGNRIQSANGQTFEHNHRNHVSSRKGPSGRTDYEYDSRGRLIRAMVSGQEWTAVYDPIGRRVSKTWQGRTTTYYWDTDRLAAEIDHDGKVRIYIYAGPLAFTPIMFLDYDSLEAAQEGATPRRYHVLADQIGTPILITDQRGREVWSARISPYGAAAIAPTSQITFNLRFPGHYHDPELGLHYNRFRYYDPVLGRYLESDPIGLAGGANLYAYSASPLVHPDARGLAKAGCPPKRGSGAKRKRESDSDAEGVAPLDVDSLQGNKRRAVSGDKLEHDHIPAFSSVVAKINKQLGRKGPLTKDQEKQLYKNLTTAEIPEDIHAAGRTYGKRGGDARVEQDAQNLRQAAAADLAEHNQRLRDEGYTKSEVAQMEKAVHDRNQALGVYDDKVPSSLWTEDLTDK